MSQNQQRVVLTGFMGVGKSTVARHLSYLLRTEKIDLDEYIEKNEKRPIPDIIAKDGIEAFREIETNCLSRIIKRGTRIISLGGGAWLTEANRELVKSNGCTSVWLESTFEHCWRNISFSKKVRPLIKNRKQAKELFEERSRFYCLAEWHFIVNPGFNSFEIAKQISSEIFTS
ncbi:MAG: shikimate kinase [Pyrinomonadaceae bacterium]|nr:shikimate kinase [Pyrinomonadaceae bacterium]